jgi:hypothetical protein
MKHFELFLFCLLYPAFIASQDITEVEMALKKNVNNFWASKKSTLVVELHRIYSIPIDPKADTLRKVYLQIFNEGYETLGVTSGISIFSAGRLGFSASGSKIEKLVKTNEFLYLDPEQFNKMYDGLNSIYTYLKTMENKTNNTLMALYEDENIKFGGTLNPKSEFDKFKFYFKYNEAVFNMSDTEFLEIVRFMYRLQRVFKVNP